MSRPKLWEALAKVSYESRGRLFDLIEEFAESPDLRRAFDRTQHLAELTQQTTLVAKALSEATGVDSASALQAAARLVAADASLVRD